MGATLIYLYMDYLDETKFTHSGPSETLET